jgi:hypothetical protein
MLAVPAYGSASRPKLESPAALTQCFLYLIEYRLLFGFTPYLACIGLILTVLELRAFLAFN